MRVANRAASMVQHGVLFQRWRVLFLQIDQGHKIQIPRLLLLDLQCKYHEIKFEHSYNEYFHIRTALQMRRSHSSSICKPDGDTKFLTFHCQIGCEHIQRGLIVGITR